MYLWHILQTCTEVCSWDSKFHHACVLHFIKHLIFPPYKTDLHGISILKTMAPASRIDASHLGPTESVPGPWELRPLGLFMWRGCHVCETILSAWNPMSFVLITRNTMRTRCPHCGLWNIVCLVCSSRWDSISQAPWGMAGINSAPSPAHYTPHHTQDYISCFNSALICLCFLEDNSLFYCGLLSSTISES